MEEKLEEKMESGGDHALIAIYYFNLAIDLTDNEWGENLTLTRKL